MNKISENTYVSVGLLIAIAWVIFMGADTYFTTKANARDLKELNTMIQFRRDLNVEFQKQVLQDLSRIKERLKIGG